MRYIGTPSLGILVVAALLLTLPAALLAAEGPSYGGKIDVTGVTFYGVCSNEAAGLLFAVGNTSNSGVVYKVNSFTTNSLNDITVEDPITLGKQI